MPLDDWDALVAQTAGVERPRLADVTSLVLVVAAAPLVDAVPSVECRVAQKRVPVTLIGHMQSEEYAAWQSVVVEPMEHQLAEER